MIARTATPTNRARAGVACAAAGRACTGARLRWHAWLHAWRHALRLSWCAAGGLALSLCLAPADALAAPMPVRLLDHAERVDPDGGVASVTLSDMQTLAPGAQGPVERLYRWRVELETPLEDTALYLSGLRAFGRLSVNGQTVFDSRPALGPRLPRSLNVPVLVRVPPAAWRSGTNVVELHAIGPRSISISALEIGPASVLAEHFHLHVLGTVIGPSVVAAIIATIGASVLYLWWRRREAIYGFFGVGVLGWAAHTVWSLSPVQLLPPLHYTVWWHVLYTFFVAMLALFAVRFSEARWPRFERTVWVMLCAAAPVLYLALTLGAGSHFTSAWRLTLIALVAVGVAAIVKAARTMPNTDRVLLSIVGVVSLGAAAHDWLVAQFGRDNNPIYAVPFVGLLFAGFVMRVLIDRFLDATQAMEAMNARLELQVAARSAELSVALEDMRLARDAAQNADRDKTRFLAAASHDLRQPAHALGLYVATLRSQPLTPDQRELVTRIDASLGALEAMFDALLDISRIDAGSVTPSTAPVALAPLLQRVADEFAPQAEQAGIRLALRIAPSRAVVHSDPLLIERIVRNLLSNAVKVTTHGGVLLAARRHRRDTGQACWRIEVWDTGPGISPEAAEHVFDEFYQIGNPGRDRRQGLGLGLAIVRRLATLLDLGISLRSRPGRGSVFTLQGLPAWDGEASPVAPADAGNVAQLNGMRVAVVEDDGDVRQAMQALLQSWGCRVVTGHDAQDVLSQAPAAPDAVIADVRLAAGRDGPQEVHELKARWAREVPSLFVTGETAPAAVQALTRAGLAWLPKPVSPERLRGWLARARPTPQPLPPRSALREDAA